MIARRAQERHAAVDPIHPCFRLVAFEHLVVDRLHDERALDADALGVDLGRLERDPREEMAREVAHSGVVWKLVSSWPVRASASRLGVWISLPKALMSE